MNMKLYLDDIRSAPKGWIQCRWPDEMFEYMLSNEVEEISLDHDLGDVSYSYLTAERTGMDVLTWMEEQQNQDPLFHIPKIKIHSANAVRAKAMRKIAKRLMDKYKIAMDSF